jgi:hypothetical protein
MPANHPGAGRKGIVMSRFTLVCSLVFGLTASASAFAAEGNFAQPPVVAHVDSAHVEQRPAGGDRMSEYRVAPKRKLDRATVRAALVKARAANLAAFRAYQRKGAYPNNTYKGGKLNVWIDEDGHLCAAATIIQMSGQVDLVARVAEQNNFMRLRDVKQGPLMDWILMSGFTQDELVMIQEPFIGVDREPQLEPTPANPVVVDGKLRKTEDSRLRAKYRAIDKQLVKFQTKSLDTAVDRLMKRPALAWELIDSQA